MTLVGQALSLPSLPNSVGQALSLPTSVGQPFGLPTCTGPRPRLRRSHQSRTYRVTLNVSSSSINLTRMPQVVVKGLILPEWLTCPAQYQVGCAGRRSLQPPHQDGYRRLRENQQMNVVRHHHPGTKFVEVPPGVSVQDGVGDHFSNLGIAKPVWSQGVPIQRAVMSHEGMSGRGVDMSIQFGRQ